MCVYMCVCVCIALCILRCNKTFYIAWARNISCWAQVTRQAVKLQAQHWRQCCLTRGICWSKEEGERERGGVWEQASGLCNAENIN